MLFSEKKNKEDSMNNNILPGQFPWYLQFPFCEPQLVLLLPTSTDKKQFPNQKKRYKVGIDM